MVLLNKLPEIVLERIVENCKFREIIVLRKVCRDLRSFIDSTIPDVRIPRILIEVQDDNIVIRYGNEEDIEYLEYEEGVGVGFADKEEATLVEGEELLDVFFNDFKFAMKYQKSKIDILSLRWEVEDEDYDYKAILIGLENVLRENPLSTRVFHIEAHDQSDILSILPYLDSEKLKEVWIFNPNKEEPGGPIDLDQVVELEQFKKLTSFAIPSHSISENYLPKFAHIPTSILHLNTISLDSLINLRVILIRSPKFQILDFHYKDFNGNLEELPEHFGPPLIESGRRKWFMKSTSSDTILGLLHDQSIHSRFIFFKVVPKDVPRNAGIHIFHDSLFPSTTH